MSGKQSIPLADARAAASSFLTFVADSCQQVEVAGSIRRGVAMVSDIEIVAIPRTHPLQAGLFGEGGGYEVDHLHEQITLALQSGDPALAPRLDKDGTVALGKRHKRLLWEELALDLFVVKPPSQWGAQIAIRTGPREFSRLLVTRRIDGGAMPFGMRQEDGALWRGQSIVETPEEADWFRELGLPYWEPWERSAERLKAHLDGRDHYAHP